MRYAHLKTFAMIYGIFLITIGLLGFIPFIAREEYIFWILKVNIATNTLHLLIGGIALWVYFLHPYFQKIYFQNIGFIFAILTIFGCISSTSIFGFIANCHMQTFVHGSLAILSLYLGFKEKRKENERNKG